MASRALNLDEFEAAAEAFADQLSRSIGTVAGVEAGFQSTLLRPTPHEPVAAVVAPRSQPLALHRQGAVALKLEARYWVTHDSRQTFLRVKKSQFRVFAPPETEASRVPVFRYEYDARFEDGRFPAAHFQVHGSHPALEQLVAAGRTGTPNITKVHFPVGGTRFRPCLEDLVEMLIQEFGIDPLPHRAQAIAALRRGREEWRTTQLAAVVRDNPSSAAEVLEGLGFTFSHKPESPPPSETLWRV